MSFDVFLSHNSVDRPVVRQIGEALKSRGLTVWLDEWELVPGRVCQEAREEIVATTRAAVVLVGSDGLGPWQDREMRGLLTQFVDRDLPVIPILLPGAPENPTLPMILKQFTWIDLRTGITDEAVERIEWGIKGVKPNPGLSRQDARSGAGQTSVVDEPQQTTSIDSANHPSSENGNGHRGAGNEASGDRNVTIGRRADGTVVITGDNNTVNTNGSSTPSRTPGIRFLLYTPIVALLAFIGGGLLLLQLELQPVPLVMALIIITFMGAGIGGWSAYATERRRTQD